MSTELSIENKLLAAFSPHFLEVVNESHMHNVAPGSESHFKVTIVTDQFIGERLINRHRAINTLLADELANKIHALALHTYTVSEWQDLFGDVPRSPKCLGGSSHDKSSLPR